MKRSTRSLVTTVVGGVATVALLTACSSADAAEETTPAATDAADTQPVDLVDPPSEAAVAALFHDWNAALATGDPATVAARYSADAVLLPTVSNEVRATPEAIEAYFVDFLQQSPQGVIDESIIRVLDDGTVKDVGVYTFTLTDGTGSTQEVQARYTFVYEMVDGEWLIAHHHSSAMPEV